LIVSEKKFSPKMEFPKVLKHASNYIPYLFQNEMRRIN